MYVDLYVVYILELYVFIKLKPEETVIGSKQIINHPTTIKQPYFAWSDR